MRPTLCLLAAFLAAAACSEARDPVDPTPASTGAGAAGPTGGTGGTSTGGTSAGGAVAGLVINEVSSTGDDYVELFNTGATAISTDGLRVADDDGGAPKLGEAVDLAGATVAPGGYLFILAGLDAAAQPGLQTQCAPGPSPCFHAAFGIGSSGDVIYLLGPGDVVLTTVLVPAGVDGQTHARIPNGSGSFVPGAPTPGTENMPP